MKFQIPKGLFDIVPYGSKEEWQLSDHWQYVESEMHQIAKEYGYQEIRTPIFEMQNLFSRGVGQTSDIVSKEMYTFQDKGGRELALRPEGTSSILRAFAEKNLYAEQKVNKFFYIGPMFRYERPQAGRYRQHHQFGIEAIGVSSPEQDVEVIDLLFTLYQRLGLKNLKVELNSIGDVQSRDTYRNALLQYLKPHLDKLSKESQDRFEKNPLRILDSKNETDKKIVEEAPSILEFLSDDAKKHFDAVCSLLKTIQIPYSINPLIVRGLDYYNKTVFEITTDHLGAQNAVGAGGRYDGFTEVFGAPSLPGIGFGAGIERIIQTMIAQNISFPKSNQPTVYVIPLGEKAQRMAFEITTDLRRSSVAAEIDLRFKKIQDALKRANKLGAKYTLILGDNEIDKGVVKLKDMEARTEEALNIDTLVEALKNK